VWSPSTNLYIRRSAIKSDWEQNMCIIQRSFLTHALQQTFKLLFCLFLHSSNSSVMLTETIIDKQWLCLICFNFIQRQFWYVRLHSSVSQSWLYCGALANSVDLLPAHYNLWAPSPKITTCGPLRQNSW
jgi:hypothetical protein